MTHTGKIVEFRCDPGSGIALLVLDAGAETVEIACENTHTVRALAELFGDGFVLDDHQLDFTQIEGQTVTATTTSYGLLESLEAAP